MGSSHLLPSGLMDTCPTPATRTSIDCRPSRRRKASTTRKAEVEDNALATFYAEGAARAPAAALGDAYAVALQRFLGELTRRGAIAGGGGEAPDFEEEPEEDHSSAIARTPIHSSQGQRRLCGVGDEAEETVPARGS